MELHPIQNFNQMSTKQKVATVAAATVTTAAIASVPLAYIQGKGAGEEKVLEAIKTGYKKIGGTIAEQFNKIKNNISKQEGSQQAPAEVPVTPKAEQAVQDLTPKADQAAEQVAPKAQEASENIGSAMIQIGKKVEAAAKRKVVINSAQITMA